LKLAGELSLEFPKASKKLRGGILADGEQSTYLNPKMELKNSTEMGLGKTIMVASLIHTNHPSAPSRKTASQPAPSSSSSSADELQSDEDSDAPYQPSPVKQKKQLRLDTKGKTRDGGSTHRAGRRSATLVVAPTSLLNQWKDELIRSSKEDLNVLVYNDQKDTSNLEAELDGGVDVVVASYGKLGFEFEKCAGPDGKGFVKKPKGGIYAVDWFRVILDEV
jgi:DNA repair protein RAD5